MPTDYNEWLDLVYPPPTSEEIDLMAETLQTQTRNQRKGKTHMEIIKITCDAPAGFKSRYISMVYLGTGKRQFSAGTNVTVDEVLDARKAWWNTKNSFKKVTIVGVLKGNAVNVIASTAEDIRKAFALFDNPVSIAVTETPATPAVTPDPVQPDPRFALTLSDRHPYASDFEMETHMIAESMDPEWARPINLVSATPAVTPPEPETKRMAYTRIRAKYLDKLDDSDSPERYRHPYHGFSSYEIKPELFKNDVNALEDRPGELTEEEKTSLSDMYHTLSEDHLRFNASKAKYWLRLYGEKYAYEIGFSHRDRGDDEFFFDEYPITGNHERDITRPQADITAWESYHRHTAA